VNAAARTVQRSHLRPRLRIQWHIAEAKRGRRAVTESARQQRLGAAPARGSIRGWGRRALSSGLRGHSGGGGDAGACPGQRFGNPFVGDWLQWAEGLRSRRVRAGNAQEPS